MDIEIENHPLEPFLPANARLLMLGSFPPQKKRWSMDFYYPNLNNDMWRIVGLLFFNNKDYFLNETRKAFCRERIISFLNDKGIALFDTASAIRRLQDNASDKFLEVVQPTDISRLLGQLPECKAIVTTGQRQQIHSGHNSKWKNPRWAISLSSSLMDARCAYTACLLLHEPIRWHSTKSGSIPHHVSGFTNA